jgi:hypothetical protein
MNNNVSKDRTDSILIVEAPRNLKMQATRFYEMMVSNHHTTNTATMKTTNCIVTTVKTSKLSPHLFTIENSKCHKFGYTPDEAHLRLSPKWFLPSHFPFKIFYFPSPPICATYSGQIIQLFPVS